MGQTLRTAFSFDYQEALAGRFKNTVTDPRGKPTLYVLNANGSPLEIQEPLGLDRDPCLTAGTGPWRASPVRSV